VQWEVFGRLVEGEPDALAGWTLGDIRIGAADYPILRPGRASDVVSGVALLVSESELAQADIYETHEYARIAVTLHSGRAAQAYVARDPNVRVV
jgi:hypothetical protein